MSHRNNGLKPQPMAKNLDTGELIYPTPAEPTVEPAYQWAEDLLNEASTPAQPVTKIQVPPDTSMVLPNAGRIRKPDQVDVGLLDAIQEYVDEVAWTLLCPLFESLRNRPLKDAYNTFRTIEDGFGYHHHKALVEAGVAFADGLHGHNYWQSSPATRRATAQAAAVFALHRTIERVLDMIEEYKKDTVCRYQCDCSAACAYRS